MRYALLSLCLLPVAVIVGCGSGDEPNALDQLDCPADNGTIGTATLTPAQSCVANTLDVETEAPNQYTVIPHRSIGGCDVAVILTSEEGISLYVDAGDAVATDTTGTIGFKTTPDCVSYLEDIIERGLR